MGVTQTILLPAGRYVDRPSTHMGKSNGLAVKAGTNESCYRLTQEYPGRYFMFANETPDVDGAREEIEKYLKLGALGIGEQKFNIDVESPAFYGIADIARDYGVPVLIHFQTGMYNHGYRRFWRVMEKYPTVTFIAHAQTTWTNVDADYKEDPKALYPKTPYRAGGITDQYLRDYEHFYVDLSAGSGLNSMIRDPEHARAFLLVHQDKILYGSDCNDHPGKPPICQGALTIAAVKRLAPSKEIVRKVLHDNAARLFRIPAVGA
jgi:predicted TIM-barrel fold metal-dependent hydrolase